MRVFLDTSAVLAMLDGTDLHAPAAAATWRGLDDDEVVTHRHVEVEAAALVQRRLGMAAVRALYGSVLPLVDVRTVDDRLHGRAVARWLEADRRGISLVDVTSFEFMTEHGITTAFAFDDDFAGAGFELL